LIRVGSVPDRFEVIRQVRWAGRRFYLAHDWEQERRVYLIQCWAGVDPAAYNHPSLPVVEALPDTDGEWLMVRPLNGASLAEMRAEGRLTEELLGDLLLAVMDGLAYLGRMVPAMVPAYVDPRFIKIGPDGWVVDYVAAVVHSSDARWSDGVMPVAYPMGGLINWLFTGKGITVGLSRPRTGWIPPWISPDLQAIMRRCLDRAYADPEDLRRDLVQVVEGKGLQGLAEKLCPEPKKERRQPVERVREDEEPRRNAASELEKEEREAPAAAAGEAWQVVKLQAEARPQSDVRQDSGEQPQSPEGGEDASQQAAAVAESQPAEAAAEQTRPRVRRKVEGLRGSAADLARLQSFVAEPGPASEWEQEQAPVAPPEPAPTSEAAHEAAPASEKRPEPAPEKPVEPVHTEPQAKAAERPKQTARVVRLGGPSKRSRSQGRPQRPAQAPARAPETPVVRSAQAPARMPEELPAQRGHEKAWGAEAPRSAREEYDVRDARDARAVREAWEAWETPESRETRGARDGRESREVREAREERATRSSRKTGNGKRQGQDQFRWITLIAGTLIVVAMVWFGVKDIQDRIAAARGENLASRDRDSTPASQVQEPPTTQTTTVEPGSSKQPTVTTPSTGQRNQDQPVTTGRRNQEQTTPAQTTPAPTKPTTPATKDDEQEPAPTPEEKSEDKEDKEPSGPAPIPAGYDYTADKAAGGMPLEVVVDGTTLGTFYLFPSPSRPQVSLHAINRFLGSNLYWEGIDLETVRVYDGGFSMVLTQDYTIINDRLWLTLTPEIQDALGLRVTGYKDGQIQFTTR